MSKDIDIEDDFGFSFIDDEVDGIKEEKKLEQEKLEELYTLIMKFLDNLSQNPEKKTLSWPDRVEKIKLFKKRIDSIKERNS